MNLVEYETGINIDFEKNNIFILQIEDGKTMFDVCKDIYDQCSGSDGNFVLSHNLETLKFCDSCEFVSNIFDLSLSGKKIENMLQKNLQKIVENDDYLKLFNEINKSVVDFNNKLLPNVDLQINYNYDLQFCDIFKLCGYKIEEKTDLFDRIIDYVDVISKLSKVKLFVFVNAFSFMSQEMANKLIEQLNYMDIRVLFLTSYLPYDIKNVGKLIVDKDLCVI